MPNSLPIKIRNSAPPELCRRLKKNWESDKQNLLKKIYKFREPLKKEDEISLINNWPPYRPEYAEMDRYLRNGGLPALYYRDHATRTFAAIGQNEKIIGFSALRENKEGKQAEFVVFIRDDVIGRGFGERISQLTLQKAFYIFEYDKIFLCVRQHKHKEKLLYEKLGFKTTGEHIKEIDGRKIGFYDMELDKEEYYKNSVPL